MGLDFSAIGGRKGGGNGGGGRETVAVLLDAVHPVDPKQATTGEDTASGWLLDNAFGLTAEFDKDGNPTTKISFTKEPQKTPTEHPPLDVFDLMRKKGNHTPMKRGGTVVLERAFRDDRTGLVKTNWLKVAVRDPELEACISGVMVSVEREKDGRGRTYQQRYVADTEGAIAFKSYDEFRAAALTALEPNPGYGGSPIAYVRIVDHDSKTPQLRRVFQGWDEVNKVPFSPEASLARWEANPENANWVEFIKENASNPDATFEIIPAIGHNTGEKSLPSMKKGRRDDADQFAFPVLKDGAPIKRRDGSEVEDFGFARGIQMVRRQEAIDTARWFATDTFRHKPFGPIYAASELITPNLPAEVAEHFERNAAARSEAKGNARKAAAGASPAAPAPAAGYAEDIPFGDPDHGGGLTPA